MIVPCQVEEVVVLQLPKGRRVRLAPPSKIYKIYVARVFIKGREKNCFNFQNIKCVFPQF